MGQKHSAKYSLKQSGNSKQQTAQIEDEVAFNTDSPGRAPDDPVGVNLSSQQNDYIRNAAQAMAKVWTETAVVESSLGNEDEENARREKECLEEEKREEAKVPEKNGENVPKENGDAKQEEEPEQAMANVESDAAKNSVYPEIFQEKLTQIAADDSQPPAEEPILEPIQYAEEDKAFPDEKSFSNNIEYEIGNQQTVDDDTEKEIQISKEEGVDEAKMDLYEENGPNEESEMIENGEEKEMNVEVIKTEMSVENVENMENHDQNEDSHKAEDNVDNQNNLIVEIEEQQNPVLEGIADYVANQQTTIQLDGNENGNEEVVENNQLKVIEPELDGKENYVPIENQNGHQENGGEKRQEAETDSEAIEVSKIEPMPISKHETTLTEEKTAFSIPTENDGGLDEENQNGHQQMECGNGEPNITGKPSDI